MCSDTRRGWLFPSKALHAPLLICGMRECISMKRYRCYKAHLAEEGDRESRDGAKLMRVRQGKANIRQRRPRGKPDWCRVLPSFVAPLNASGLPLKVHRHRIQEAYKMRMYSFKDILSRSRPTLIYSRTPLYKQRQRHQQR